MDVLSKKQAFMTFKEKCCYLTIICRGLNLNSECGALHVLDNATLKKLFEVTAVEASNLRSSFEQIGLLVKVQSDISKYVYRLNHFVHRDQMKKLPKWRQQLVNVILNSAVELSCLSRLMLSVLWAHALVVGQVEMSFSRLAELCGVKVSPRFYKALKQLYGFGYFLNIVEVTDAVPSTFFDDHQDSRSAMDLVKNRKDDIGIKSMGTVFYLNPLHPLLSGFLPPLKVMVSKKYAALDSATRKGDSSKVPRTTTHWGYRIAHQIEGDEQACSLMEVFEQSQNIRLRLILVGRVLSKYFQNNYKVSEIGIFRLLDGYDFSALAPIYKLKDSPPNPKSPSRYYSETLTQIQDEASGRLLYPKSSKGFINAVLSLQRVIDHLVELALTLRPSKHFEQIKECYQWLKGQKEFKKSLNSLLPLKGVSSAHVLHDYICAIVAYELNEYWPNFIDGFADSSFLESCVLTVLPVLNGNGVPVRISIMAAKSRPILPGQSNSHTLFRQTSKCGDFPLISSPVAKDVFELRDMLIKEL